MTAQGTRRALTAAMLVAALVLGGCATVAGQGNGDAPPRRAQVDPLEGMNRAMFAFNEVLDDVLLEPVARAYVKVVPEVFRWMITNALNNLADVRIALNQLLQGKPLLAGSDLLRFGINTMFGFGGVADIATELGLERHTRISARRMGRWGIANGPYLVLPLFGPSTLRDGLGLVVDVNTSPSSRCIARTWPTVSWRSALVDTRAGLLKARRPARGRGARQVPVPARRLSAAAPIPDLGRRSPGRGRAAEMSARKRRTGAVLRRGGGPLSAGCLARALIAGARVPSARGSDGAFRA